MYIRKDLLGQIIKVFSLDPKYRDDRMLTIEKVVKTHYRKWFGKDIVVTAKLISDIDRAFRYIQQHIPTLRGKNWLLRQRLSGEISEQEYQNNLDAINDIQKICKQMKLPFEI